jgi:hypothetical protein
MPPASGNQAAVNPCLTCRFASYGTQRLRAAVREPILRCAFSNREIAQLAGCTRHEREPGSDDHLA